MKNVQTILLGLSFSILFLCGCGGVAKNNVRKAFVGFQDCLEQCNKQSYAEITACLQPDTAAFNHCRGNLGCISEEIKKILAKEKECIQASRDKQEKCKQDCEDRFQAEVGIK